MSGQQRQTIYSTYEFLGVLFIWCEQDFYPGGERRLGAVDLEVQREAVTGTPICRSSSLKGALRAFFKLQRASAGVDENEIFGDQNRAGAIEFQKAGILLYPVQSYIGLFAYITSPYQLREYWINNLRNGRVQNVDVLESKLQSLEGKLDGKKAIITKDSIFRNTDIVLYKGEFIFKSDTCEPSEDLDGILNELLGQAIPKVNENVFTGYSYIKSKIEKSTILVSNQTFRNIVNRTLPRITRIRIQSETKTVEKGGLFIQEFIPKHTLLAAGLYKAIRYNNGTQINNFKSAIQNALVNVGGSETVGYGMIRLVIYP